MDIPFSLEIVVEVALFVFAGIGGIMAYFIGDIRIDVKGLREKLDAEHGKYECLDKRLCILETKINICKECPKE